MEMSLPLGRVGVICGRDAVETKLVICYLERLCLKRVGDFDSLYSV